VKGYLDDSQNAGLEQQCQEVLKRPGAFAFAVIKHFRANQGLLLAGAVAYYTLLSLIPLLILILMVLSNIFEEDRLLLMLREYLEFVVPGQSNALVEELRNFLLHRELGRFSARGDLQCPGVYGSGERHVGDFLSPRRDQAAALPRVCSDAVSVHPLSGHRRAHRHFGVRRASFHGYQEHHDLRLGSLVGPALRVASLHRGRDRGGPFADRNLPGDAGGANILPSCVDRRGDGRSAMGNHPPHPRLVLHDDVADTGRLRLSSHVYRGPVERRDRRLGAAPGSVSDRGVRPYRPRADRGGRSANTNRRFWRESGGRIIPGFIHSAM
jgi:hypothetical protein